MKVETYECEETASEPAAASDEAKALIEKLGLKGQQALIAPADCPAGEVRIPYRLMTDDEFQVFSVLCRTHQSIEQYEAGPIPLRILQVAAHANGLDFFDRLEVWHQPSVQVKDPVLVGIRKDPVNTWRNFTYILGRWGEELDEMPALLRKATEAARQRATEHLKGCIENAQAALSGVAEWSLGKIWRELQSYIA